MSQNDLPIVCVVSPSKDAYSETFIKAHVERLPARTKLLYGGELPRYEENDKKLRPPMGQRVLWMLFKSLLRLPKDYKQQAALAHFLKKNKVKAVLAEYGPTGAAIMDVCRELRIPLIVHFHGYDAHKYATIEKYGESYKKMFEIADAVIVVSRDMERSIIELGAKPEKVFCSPSGVDCEIFAGTDPSKNPPIFLAVGRFVNKKAPILTLMAFRKVLDACPEAKLVMIGDGPLLDASKQVAKALKIDKSVEFKGALPHKTVADEMKKARALALHSIRPEDGDAEGVPNVIMEAGAMGLPVVSTLHAGIKDIVARGETGFLVEERDIENMAKYMTLLAQNPAMAYEMGVKARERVCAHFSKKQHIATVWNIIENALKTHT